MLHDVSKIKHINILDLMKLFVFVCNCPLTDKLVALKLHFTLEFLN